MSYQYSLAHLTVLGCPPPEMIYIAALTGYNYVSPRIIMLGLPEEADYNLATNKDLFRRTKSALKETGLKVHDIELARIHDSVDVRTYESALEIAAELGAKAVISSVWSTNTEFVAEQLALLCDTARKYGINVNFEFVTWSDIPTLKDAKALLKKVNRENTGFLIDTLHFNRSRVALEELDDLPADRYHFVHLCDGPAEIPTDKEGLIYTGRDARLYVGEGGIDFGSILNRMDPDLVLSIELPHIQRVKEYGNAEHARRCIETAKAHLTALECYSVLSA